LKEQPETARARWLRRGFWALVFLAVPYLVFQFRGSLRLIPADQAVPATRLELMDLDGEMVDLADHRGKVVLLNLWAGWCGPCRREIPGLSRLHDRMGPDGLVVLGINIDALPRHRVRELSNDLGIRYPVTVPTGPFTGSFRESGVIPHTWLIDRQGRMRASHSGLATQRSLRRASQKLLAEP
jgi:thiol-disulfide isomerase/thioredoxin